ncbi:STAS domain-containing protein [Aquabacterium sp. A7-Y]|uniref:STAS domain-containing protein n=1 Tax=Aquabacterium sp. A7-Y TaxID=1349605 RepID=UPI00223CD716|nr:STAS domain-containing protein [Aquabacterium sp. A7-Y]MCW7537081.1 STAS domain-containing protein [Aquabacterium sp. A7-Y]
MSTASTARPDGVLRIEGEMTIYRAAELGPLLLAALTPAGALALDLAEVTEFDSAGLQLLLAARRSARELGGELRLSATSPAIDEVLGLLSLGEEVGLTTPHSPQEQAA